jgi:hypothetical protein
MKQASPVARLGVSPGSAEAGPSACAGSPTAWSCAMGPWQSQRVACGVDGDASSCPSAASSEGSPKGLMRIAPRTVLAEHSFAWYSLAGCSTERETRLAMNLAVRTGSRVRVTSTMPLLVVLRVRAAGVMSARSRRPARCRSWPTPRASLTAGDRTAELLAISWSAAMVSGVSDNIRVPARMIPSWSRSSAMRRRRLLVVAHARRLLRRQPDVRAAAANVRRRRYCLPRRAGRSASSSS